MMHLLDALPGEKIKHVIRGKVIPKILKNSTIIPNVRYISF